MNKLVLFDIDKTLIHGSSAHKDAFRVAFKKVYDVIGSQDDINHHGKTDRQIIIEVLKIKGLKEDQIFRKIDECIQTIIDVYNQTAKNDQISLLDAVKELLEEFEKRKVLMGLVTGNIESIARSKLTKVNLNQYFKLGGFGSDPHNDRSDLVKLAIKKAESKFGFKSDGKNVFLFGDAVADMQAGKEGGATTIGVTTGVFTKEELQKAGADFVLPDLKDKNEVLKILSLN